MQSFATDPGGAIFELRGIFGMIYVVLLTTLLHTKYTSSLSCDFREEDILFICAPSTDTIILTLPVRDLYGHKWQRWQCL